MEDPEFVDMLDSQDWYTRTALVVDAISLAGATAAGAATIKLALTLRAQTGKSMVAVLKGLSRQQRKQLAEEAIRLEHAGISNGQLKALVRAGRYPKRYTPLEVNETIRSQLMDAASSALTFTGSATSGLVREGGELVVGCANGLESE